MRKIYVVFSVLLAAVLLTGCIDQLNFSGWGGSDNTPSPQPPATQTSVIAYFCPDDACDDVLISEIDKAQKTVHIAIYSFTLENVRDALIRAKARGVEVMVVFDKQQAGSQYSVYDNLKALKFDVRVDGHSDYMHNKFAVIDGKTVVTGSYNWSKHATDGNDENFVVITSGFIAALYEQEFQEIWDEGE
jgi:phosphatidylserine/phosphatidylglycerophosphate/cardiolipin synthase-like enzyme